MLFSVISHVISHFQGKATVVWMGCQCGWGLPMLVPEKSKWLVSSWKWMQNSFNRKLQGKLSRSVGLILVELSVHTYEEIKLNTFSWQLTSCFPTSWSHCIYSSLLDLISIWDHIIMNCATWNQLNNPKSNPCECGSAREFQVCLCQSELGRRTTMSS